MIRKLVRRLGVGAAVLAGVLLIAYATLHLPFVRAAVLERARGYALRELGMRARCVEPPLCGARAIGRASQRQARGLRRGASVLQAEAMRVVLDRRLFRGLVADRTAAPRRSRGLAIVRHANGTTNLPRERSTPGTRRRSISAWSTVKRSDDRACR